MEGTGDSSTKYGPTKTRRPTHHHQYHQPNTSNTALMNLCDQYGPYRHYDFLCYCCCCCRHRQDHPALLPLPSPPPLLLMPLHLLPPPLLPRNNNNHHHHHSINNGSNHHYPKKPSWKQQKPSRSPSSVEEGKTNSATTKVIDTHPTKVNPLIKHEHRSLTRRLAHTEPLVVARRPDLGGREGTTIALLANHFKVGFDPSQRIFLYDVDITPRPSKEVARMIKSRLVQDNPSILSESLPVYDGRRSLYSPVKFQHDRLEFYVSLPLRNDNACQLKNDNSKLFRVNIRLASKLDGCELARYLREEEEPEGGEDGIVPLPQDYLQALDIALRESPGEKCIRMGRCLYSNDSGTDIGGGAVGLRGFFQSLRSTQQGLTLNVDFSVMAFHESIGVIPYLQKRLDFLRDLPQKKWRALTEDERREVERALKNMRVFVCHRDTDQRYRVYGLTEEATEDLRFRDRDGGELRVVDYFKDNYNHDIQFRNLPCLQIGGSKPCYLPMELCMVCEGQKFLGKLSDDQTTRILKMGCQKPGERRAIINRIMGGAISPASCYASQFNLKVSKEMTRLTGRVLQPPRLKFGDNGHVRDLIPTRHDRQWSLLDCHVAEGIRINRWALISFGGTPEQQSCVPRFIKQLCHRCNLLGINLSKNTIVAPQFESMQVLNSVSALEKKLRKIHEAASNELQLLICVMERKHKGYADLKRIAETSIGVLSQCCLYQNLSKLGSQFLVNLALKINAKAGGRNVALYNSFSRQVPRLLADDEPVIFMGADVTHPHPLDDVSPSIVAVVGSMDWPAVNRYVSRMRSQTHRQEIIQDLTEMVEELLNEFQQCVKKLPKRILFFRDGVSETQFHKVLDKELKAIQAACSRFQQPYRPAITFAVVQKRHHTRLFLDESSEPGSSADENVPAGTVVDTVITHPREFDFYLCTHWGTKGTSRPTHYHVLWDDSRFTSDELQMLIHSLCYTFVRCTKPVSLVPPAYYAHLAAYRGRLYLDRPELIGRTTYSRAAPPSQATPLPKLSDKIKKLMFYC